MKTRKFMFEHHGLQILSKVLFTDKYPAWAQPKRHVQVDYVRLLKNVL